MNLLISGVTSQVTNSETQAENSDDDVIEVVRDEAPIEILSDGEELELERRSLPQPSVIQNFHYTSPTQTSVVAEQTNAVKDPITNDSLLVNDKVPKDNYPLVCAVPIPVTALPPPPPKPIEEIENSAVMPAISNSCNTIERAINNTNFTKEIDEPVSVATLGTDDNNKITDKKETIDDLEENCGDAHANSINVAKDSREKEVEGDGKDKECINNDKQCDNNDEENDSNISETIEDIAKFLNTNKD